MKTPLLFGLATALAAGPVAAQSGGGIEFSQILLSIAILLGVLSSLYVFVLSGKMGGGGGSDEVILDLQDRVEVLEADIEAIAVSLTELQDEYDEHLEEFHDEKPVERPPIVTGGGGGGGGVKPPTSK